MDFAHRRRMGYEDAISGRGLAIDPFLMQSEEMTESYGYRAAVDMLHSAAPPTAFLVSSIICAWGVRRAIDAAGLVMGRDISVVIHDDELSYLQNGGAVPIFTATRSSVREAGRRLAEMLLDRIAHPGAAAQTALLEADLVVGRSTGPAPRG